MSIHIKICGITDRIGAEAAIEAGADALGFVLARSVREISPEQATSIADTLPPGPDRVAVFRGPPGDDIVAALRGFAADMVQADHRSLTSLQGRRLLPVYRERRDSVGAIARSVDGGRFVYEGEQSGVGRAVDWALAAEVALSGQMTLAGGLHAGNVGEAIRTVRPFGVDVSSGVESSPGVKDPALIRAFVEAVRAAEKELVKA